MLQSLVFLYRQRWNTYFASITSSFLFVEHLPFYMEWFRNFLLFSLFVIPAMAVYGLPVHLVAVFATHHVHVLTGKTAHRAAPGLPGLPAPPPGQNPAVRGAETGTARQFPTDI
jgi:hypothetical protein